MFQLYSRTLLKSCISTKQEQVFYREGKIVNSSIFSVQLRRLKPLIPPRPEMPFSFCVSLWLCNGLQRIATVSGHLHDIISYSSSLNVNSSLSTPPHARCSDMCRQNVRLTSCREMKKNLLCCYEQTNIFHISRSHSPVVEFVPCFLVCRY